MSNKNKISNKIYVPVYSKPDYEKDEKDFNESMKTGNVNWNSFQRLLMNDLCYNTKISTRQ